MQPRMSTTESISSDKPISIGDHIEYVGKDETTAPTAIHKSCSIAGDGGEFVIIGDHKYYRHELMQAFGGTLNPGLSPYQNHVLDKEKDQDLKYHQMLALIHDDNICDLQ